jgi:double-stranded uracil-DNA glycosylase
VRPSEFVHGRELLRAKIEAVQPRLVIFTFKKTADVLFGPFAGSGQIQGLDLGGAPVFVMPGPFRPRTDVEAGLSQLRALLD